MAMAVTPVSNIAHSPHWITRDAARNLGAGFKLAEVDDNDTELEDWNPGKLYLAMRGRERSNRLAPGPNPTTDSGISPALATQLTAFLQPYQNKVKSLETLKNTVSELESEVNALRPLKKTVSELQSEVDALRPLKIQVGELKIQVGELKIYDDAGTCLVQALYSLIEVGVEMAGELLRRVISRALLEQAVHHPNFELHVKRFSASFHSDYIESADYCRCTVWKVNCTGKSLAEYWAGDWTGRGLCNTWNKKTGGDAMTSDLNEWVSAAEKLFAEYLGVDSESLRVCLGLYSTCVRHERNEKAHFFSIYWRGEPQSGSGARAGTQQTAANKKVKLWLPRRFPDNMEDCITRLGAALAPQPLKLLTWPALRSRYYVLMRLRKQVGQLGRRELHVGELDWVADRALVCEALAAKLLSRFPVLVANFFRSQATGVYEDFTIKFNPSSGNLLVSRGQEEFRYKFLGIDELQELAAVPQKRVIPGPQKRITPGKPHAQKPQRSNPEQVQADRMRELARVKGSEAEQQVRLEEMQEQRRWQRRGGDGWSDEVDAWKKLLNIDDGA